MPPGKARTKATVPSYKEPPAAKAKVTIAQPPPPPLPKVEEQREEDDGIGSPPPPPPDTPHPDEIRRQMLEKEKGVTPTSTRVESKASERKGQSHQRELQG